MDVSNLQATVTAGTCSSRIIFNVPDARAQRRQSGIEAGKRLPTTPPLPDRGRGHLALARRRRLGRLPQRYLPFSTSAPASRRSATRPKASAFSMAAGTNPPRSFGISTRIDF